MSSSSTPVTQELFDYLAARTRGEDAFLRELKTAARAAGMPEIWISPEQASLMQILLASAGAKRVLEVGTLAGYSAIAMARALPPAAEGGQLVTVEIDPARARFAREWAARSDVGDRIEVVNEPGASALARQGTDAFDAAFLDADKGGYAVYLEHCLRIVRPGGLILVDNAFAFGQLLERGARDPEVAAVRAFNERMAATPGLQGVIVPIGDGLWVAVRERGAKARPASGR